jgi:predicted dehydrogenase
MTSAAVHSRELVDIADKKRLTLMVGHTFIYSAPVRKIKEIIDSGELGEIYYISSRRLNLGLFQRDINVTWDLAPHGELPGQGTYKSRYRGCYQSFP